jgi:glutamyl-tRNA reductase
MAVPRDIEPEVAELDDVYLFTVDDLQEVIIENMRSRENAADKAEKIIEDGVIEWKSQIQALDSVSLIRNFRKKIESTRDIEIQKAIVLLQSGQDPEEVLKNLARNLTNKLMHTPSKMLKKAAENGRKSDIRLTKDLFGLTKTNEIEPE